jgi:sortase A
MRRLARILSVALITAGLVVGADAGLTVLWKEPVSAFTNTLRQNAADSELDSVSEDFLKQPETQTVSTRDPARAAERLADLFEKSVSNGQPIGRIRIPSIGADYVVIQGTDEGDLERGPGHYPETAFPGQGKTVAIAGHRTTYGAPFNKIDDIDVGDTVELDMPYAKFTYEVTDTDIVDPSDVHIVDDTGEERLVLTACHPLYSAAQRYAVFAKLGDIELKAGSGAQSDAARAS